LANAVGLLSLKAPDGLLEEESLGTYRDRAGETVGCEGGGRRDARPEDHRGEGGGYGRRRGIPARIARIGVESKERLGRHRWVVERTMAWLLSYTHVLARI
jgi:hypothetical protein